MPYGNNDWLALTDEPALEPKLPICDPHHHFWDYRMVRMPYQRYLLHELVSDIDSGHNVTSTVFIEAGAMYRAATLYAMKERYVINGQIDIESIVGSLDRLFLSFKYNLATETSEIHLGGVNVEKEIRTLEVARNVSLIAKIPEVRKKLIKLINHKIIDFVGSDIHNMRHISAFENKVKFGSIKLVEKIIENNNQFE